MNRQEEIQLAKRAYNWLKVSPILTVGTVFFIAASDLGYFLCDGAFQCSSDDLSYINISIGVLISALWHLLLMLENRLCSYGFGWAER